MFSPPLRLHGSPARSRMASPKPSAPFPGSNIASNLSPNATASAITTIRKLRTSTPRSKALDAFPGRVLIVLGGKDKGSDYTVLRTPLREKAILALLIGAAAQENRKPKIAGSVAIERAGTLHRAVEVASRAAQPGDIVLLAPACASFDQFEKLRTPWPCVQAACPAVDGTNGPLGFWKKVNECQDVPKATAGCLESRWAFACLAP